jgi:hypothetical protein
MLAPGTKKIAICQRRLGTRDRMVQIALCTNETMADRIVQGLHLRQKQIVKLEVPLERELEAARARIQVEAGYVDSVKATLRSVEAKNRELTDQLANAIRERDAAQKAARETA